MLYCLSMLQLIPYTAWYSKFLCLVSIELSYSRYTDSIPITCNRVINTECLYLISFYLKMLLLPAKLYHINLKRQFRCYYSQRIYNSCKPLRTDKSEWFLSVGVTHSKQKPRKTAYMVCMIMRKAYDIYRIITPPFFLYGYLSSFTTIYKQAAPVISCHK